MIRNRILLKSAAVFFLMEMFVSVFSPAVSWALTAGPTAPEATSFEPVDTTAMVNLSSGDLAYNIPLLEVPGPNGGYPLSLSYHGGIMPDEEASWVGLGWTLNPGAIVRNVNGFADDQKNQANFSRFYWDGGETTSYSVGVTIGQAGTPASLSAGLTYSQDTYQGSGVGWSAGLDFSFKKGPGVGVTVGVGPYGDPYASAGVNLSVPLVQGQNNAAKLTGSIGISTNFKTISGSTNASVSYGRIGKQEPDPNNPENVKITDPVSVGIMGASMSSSMKGSVSLLSQAASGSNSASKHLSTRDVSVAGGITIGPFLSISFGYHYQRYWIDELDKFKVNGSLYYPDNSEPLDITFFNKNAYDTYSLLDPTLDGGIVDNPNPDKVLGGSFPGYDNYTVHAQGVFGNMRPYYYQKHLYKRNSYSKDSDGDKIYKTKQYDLSQQNVGERNYRAEFRFINDFSNRFEYEPDSIKFIDQSGPDGILMNYSFNQGSEVKIGESGSDNYTSNDVQGSRNIVWLTNDDIIQKTSRAKSAKFIETVSSGFARNIAGLESNIGAFVVTNESGVKYHFALPAYSYDEYTQQRKKSGTVTFNDMRKPGRYAYTWYLTAVTGPDFVDRGPEGGADGLLNEYDFGHWVEFEYGKWTDIYAWRNPGEGMTSDIDNKFKNFSEGRKELYYLDAIRTKSHTAIFFKDIRHDAKSSTYFFHNVKETYELDGDFKRRETPTEYSREGGFIPKMGRCECEKQTIYGDFDFHQDKGHLDYISFPTSTLKLSSILLISNDSLASAGLSKLAGTQYAQNYAFAWDIQENTHPSERGQCDFSTQQINHHLYANVYDIHDLQNAPTLQSKATRVVDFGTSYDLCPETVNSFDQKLIASTNMSTNSADYPKKGKLTLDKVAFRGKSGFAGLPDIKFSYDLSKLQHRGLISKYDGKYLLKGEGIVLEEGEIVKFRSQNLDYFALIETDTWQGNELRFLGENVLPSTGYVIFNQTKNPPYNSKAHDMWGLYKSDYKDLDVNEKLEQMVTSTSAKSIDVWSLQSIRTSTGAQVKLKYESDTYNKPVLSLFNDISITKMEKIGNYSRLTLATTFPKLDEILIPGTSVDYLIGFADPYSFFDFDDMELKFRVSPNVNSGTLVVQSIMLSNDEWVITTTSDLETFYSERSNTSDRTYHTPIFVVGNLNSTAPVENFGGGIRVKSVSVESFNQTLTTKYDYSTPTNTGSVGTSGVTSYEPGGIEQTLYMYPLSGENKKFFENTSNKLSFEKAFNREFYKSFETVLANSREILAPGVMYQYVTVSSSTKIDGVVTESENRSTNEFEVFRKEMFDFDYGDLYQKQIPQDTLEPQPFQITPYDLKERRKVTLKDHTAQVGLLKRVTLFSNSGEILSQTENHYLHDGKDSDAYEQALDASFNNQGVIEETFTDARFAKRKDSDYFSLQGVVAKREQYPIVQIGQTTTNFKTGIENTSEIIAYDYYSGQSTQTISKDGYGNSFKTVKTPAYRHYAMMGQVSQGGKNMLTQEAGSTVYKVNPEDYSENVGLISANAQTWSSSILALTPGNIGKQNSIIQDSIWRKHASFSFVGNDNVSLLSDGLYPAANFTPFDGWSTGVSNGWLKSGEITLIDVNSNTLEVTDLNGKFAATHMSTDQRKVMAGIVNARYDEVAVSGVEEINSGLIGAMVSKGDATIDGERSHTGLACLRIAQGQMGFNSSVRIQQRQKNYLVSAWVHEQSASNAKLNYQFIAQTSMPPQSIPFVIDPKKKAGEWYLVEVNIQTPESLLDSDVELMVSIGNVGSAAIYVDDFRLLPRDAAIISYVYNGWGELTYILGNDNKFTQFEYDGMGRLISTYAESFDYDVKKMSSQTYHYATQN